jgi:hypothetical protein
MSFFPPAITNTLPKPKPKLGLPDAKIKKRDPSAALPPPAPVQAPIPQGPGLLATTLSQLTRKALPLLNTQPTTNIDPGPSVQGDGKPKPNKKGHMVKFRDLVPGGGALEEVREFTQMAKELEVPEWQIDQVPSFPGFRFRYRILIICVGHPWRECTSARC